MNRGSFFWGLTFIAIVNVFLVIVSAVHHTDLWVRLPLLTILLSVVIIWAASARLFRMGYIKCAQKLMRMLCCGCKV